MNDLDTDSRLRYYNVNSLFSRMTQVVIHSIQKRKIPPWTYITKYIVNNIECLTGKLF